MGDKKILEKYQIVGPANPLYANSVLGHMTGTATILSNPVHIKNQDNVGMQVHWTGTPTGTISVVCSIDGTTYDALTFNPVLAQPAGAAGGYLINLNQVPYPYVKLQYINSSGTGEMVAFICAKDLN